VQTINVHFLPSLTTPEQLAGKTVVVIDVLRATTTIVQALAAGAKEVIPCLEVAEVRRLAKKCKGPNVLGGERGGVKIEGFDLGNSPAEYTRKAVQGKTVFFTTTNGTRAMMACERATRVLLGAFTNLAALCDKLASETAIEIVCAGTDGQITREDVLLAGALIDRLDRPLSLETATNDQASIAQDSWLQCHESEVPLDIHLLGSRGGVNLYRLRHVRDIRLAAKVDKHTIVPELLLKEWKIVAAGKQVRTSNIQH
jgi:2-phosphosulfolactate phosphatase